MEKTCSICVNPIDDPKLPATEEELCSDCNPDEEPEEVVLAGEEEEE